MTAHHLITEGFTRTVCPYCWRTMNEREWGSEFEREVHYKSAVCECGKNIRLKVDFQGSGHDDWQERTTPFLPKKDDTENLTKSSIEDKLK